MRTIINGRGMLIGLALVAIAGMSACSANRTTSSTGPGSSQTTSPAANSSVSAGAAASVAAGTPSATPTASGGIQNLVISSAERSALTAAFVAFKGISLSDIYGSGPMAGTVYYAYDPATNTYWALADFGLSSTASFDVQVSFQDGGRVGMFRKAVAGTWQVGNPGVPFFCGEARWFPPRVLMAWSMPTTPPAGLTC